MYDIRNISDLEKLITTIKPDKITYVYYKNDIYNTLYVGYTQQQNKKKIHYLKNHHKMSKINDCFDNCIYIRIFLNCSEKLLVYILKPVLNSSKSHTFNNNKLNYCYDINKNLYIYDPNILTKNIKNKNYDPNLLKYNNCDFIDERCKIINIYKNSFEIKQIYDDYMFHKKHKLIELLKYKLILCHLQINKQEYKKYLISQTQDCNYEFIYILLYCKSKYYIKSFKIIKDIIDKFKIFLKLYNIENEIIHNKQHNNYFSIINYLLKMCIIHKLKELNYIYIDKQINIKFIRFGYEDYIINIERQSCLQYIYNNFIIKYINKTFKFDLDIVVRINELSKVFVDYVNYDLYNEYNKIMNINIIIFDFILTLF